MMEQSPTGWIKGLNSITPFWADIRIKSGKRETIWSRAGDVIPFLTLLTVMQF